MKGAEIFGGVGSVAGPSTARPTMGPWVAPLRMTGVGDGEFSGVKGRLSEHSLSG